MKSAGAIIGVAAALIYALLGFGWECVSQGCRIDFWFVGVSENWRSMGKFQTLPQLESWLDIHAASWLLMPDLKYTTLVDQWRAVFWPLIEAGNITHSGHRAMMVLESRLPCDMFAFSGVQIPRVMNLGGRGRAAYRALGLRSLDRDLANRLELVMSPVDLSWCCVFTHEAGGIGWEHLYEPLRHGRYSWQSEGRANF